MKVQIVVRGADVAVTKTLRAHVESRLETALGRFGDRIGGVLVRFSEPEGPMAGPDEVRCAIQVSLRPRNVQAEGTDRDVFSVVEQVSTRLSRSIARAIERERDLDPAFAGPVAPRRFIKGVR